MGRLGNTELTCWKQRTPKQQTELSMTPLLVLLKGIVFALIWILQVL